jgi:hypothetical protein
MRGTRCTEDRACEGRYLRLPTAFLPARVRCQRDLFRGRSSSSGSRPSQARSSRRSRPSQLRRRSRRRCSKRARLRSRMVSAAAKSGGSQSGTTLPLLRERLGADDATLHRSYPDGDVRRKPEGQCRRPTEAVACTDETPANRASPESGDQPTSSQDGRSSLLRRLAATNGSLRGFPGVSRAGSVRDAREAGGRSAREGVDLQVF